MPAARVSPTIFGVRAHPEAVDPADRQRLVYRLGAGLLELVSGQDGPGLAALAPEVVREELRSGRLYPLPAGGGGALAAAVRGVVSGRAGPEALAAAMSPAGVDGGAAVLAAVAAVHSPDLHGARAAFASAIEEESRRDAPAPPQQGTGGPGAPNGGAPAPMGAQVTGIASVLLGGGIAAMGAWMSGGASALAASAGAAAAGPLGPLVSAALTTALPDSPADLPDSTRAAVLGIESAANVPVAFTGPVDSDGVVNVGGNAVARVGDLAGRGKQDAGPIKQGNPSVRVTGLPVAGQGHAVETKEGPEAVGAPMCLPTVLMGSTTATPGAAEPSTADGPGGSTAAESPAAGQAAAGPGASSGTPEDKLLQDAPGQLVESAATDGSEGAMKGAEAAQRAAETARTDALSSLDEQLRALESERARGLINATRELSPGENPLIRDAGLETVERTTAEIERLKVQHGELAGAVPGPSRVLKALDTVVDVGSAAFDVVGVVGAWVADGVEAAADKAISAGAAGVTAGAAASGTAAVICAPANAAPGVGQLGWGGCVVGSAAVGFAVGAATELGVGYALCKARIYTGLPADHCLPKP